MIGSLRAVSFLVVSTFSDVFATNCTNNSIPEGLYYGSQAGLVSIQLEVLPESKLVFGMFFQFVQEDEVLNSWFFGFPELPFRYDANDCMLRVDANEAVKGGYFYDINKDRTELLKDPTVMIAKIKEGLDDELKKTLNETFVGNYTTGKLIMMDLPLEFNLESVVWADVVEMQVKDGMDQLGMSGANEWKVSELGRRVLSVPHIEVHNELLVPNGIVGAASTLVWILLLVTL